MEVPRPTGDKACVQCTGENGREGRRHSVSMSCLSGVGQAPPVGDDMPSRRVAKARPMSALRIICIAAAAWFPAAFLFYQVNASSSPARLHPRHESSSHMRAREFPTAERSSQSSPGSQKQDSLGCGEARGVPGTSRHRGMGAMRGGFDWIPREERTLAFGDEPRMLVSTWQVPLSLRLFSLGFIRGSGKRCQSRHWTVQDVTLPRVRPG